MGTNSFGIELSSVSQEMESIIDVSQNGLDSVKDYLANAGKAPLLTKEKEIELAKRIEVKALQKLRHPNRSKYLKSFIL